MEQMKEKKFAKKKRLIGTIILFLAVIAIVIPALKIYADSIAAAIVEDEKTIVRTASALSRGENSDSVVDIGTLPTFLNKYAGSGATSVASATSEIIKVIFASTGHVYDINIYTGPTFDVVGGSSPYIPTGYTAVPGTDLTTGFVVQDQKGNQFVWVEVPRTSEVYPTAGLGITSFTDDEYNLIEADLHTYTSTYRNGTEYLDEYYSDEATGLTSVEYYTQKKKMLKSIYKYGGFYVGRYETGINYSQSHRTASGDTTQTPVIKQNTYPYNYVTPSQAQTLSESFSTTGYSSSLMFGVQWDLVLKYLETKGATQAQLNQDSTSLGNYTNNLYKIINTNAKYSTDSGATWLLAPYEKEVEGATLLTTGANSIFSKQNISDIAGNVWEWTLEKNSLSTEYIIVLHGGAYYDKGSIPPASYRTGQSISFSDECAGFRVALYKEEANTKTPSYIPTGYTHVAGTDMDTGYVVQDELGNQYVWVEVPRTAAVYPTAGVNVTSFTADEYTKIETDLHTYTATYGNSSYSDTYSADLDVGLTEYEYNTQKKKMLKSIYKNEGFYIGRYETGIDYSEDYRIKEDEDTEQTPVIKQNAYPYNFVTVSQAQELSESFASELEGYTSSMMFGVQFELILKYLETKGASQAELMTDSITWGNYSDNIYNITNTNAKYYQFISNDDVITWNSAPYNKTAENRIFLTTGASNTFSKQNIYDLAGNMWERTLERVSNGDGEEGNYGIFAGAGHISGAVFPVARRYGSAGTVSRNAGFRVSLYKDEGTGQDSTTTKPTYIPAGYTHVAGTTMENGYVIQDPSGNQYVWVEVPKTAAVYPTAGLSITNFTSAEYNAIEADLHTYTSAYAQSGYEDEYYSDDAYGLTNREYNDQKKKMLKSIYKYGGFYVGRYETGIEGAESNGSGTQTPVIKQNAYPYNLVTASQSQSLASSFASTGYTSSMLFGVQWDLIMRYLETKGTARAELSSDSTGWANYASSTYNIENQNAKYWVNEVSSSWQVPPYEHAYGENTILTTGASDQFCKQNIYDLAGNMWETTLEKSDNTGSPITVRGGSYVETTWGIQAVVHAYIVVSGKANNHGFRVTLYKDEGIGPNRTTTTPTYIPTGYTHVAGTSMDTGYVVQDPSGNQYVWVEVPKTVAVYPTAGLSITNFTSAEYNAIEADLHAYTSTYREGRSGLDEYYSDEVTGLTRIEYNTQKKKMLKSIYKNGGFYVGRYETGIDYGQNPRTAGGETTQTPVIKQNAYPYNYVTTSQSQTLAQSFATTGYSSSLMFGVQWDLVLKYLENSHAVAVSEINSDSTEWGNYTNSTYTTNANGKYAKPTDSYVWKDEVYNKTSGESVLLTTGASSKFEKGGLYDIAGNVNESTLEYNTSNSQYICTGRGGAYHFNGNVKPANTTGNALTTDAYRSTGFRVALYTDEEVNFIDDDG